MECGAMLQWFFDRKSMKLKDVVPATSEDLCQSVGFSCSNDLIWWQEHGEEYLRAETSRLMLSWPVAVTKTPLRKNVVDAVIRRIMGRRYQTCHFIPGCLQSARVHPLFLRFFFCFLFFSFSFFIFIFDLLVLSIVSLSLSLSLSLALSTADDR